MKFKEVLQESTLALTSHKIRTGLAVLGVVIGIGSVIALMSLGQASQKNITSNIQALGSNLLTIMPGSISSFGVRGARGGAETLTLADSQAIETQVSLVKASAPYVSSNSQVVAGRNNININVYGVTASYAQVRNLELNQGLFITDQHDLALARVAVLGATAATDLFETNSPIGQTIRLNGQVLKVIGVLASKGGMGWESPDEAIYVPLRVSQKVLFGQDNLSGLAVSIIDEKSMTIAQAQIESLLLKRHQITDPDKADFRIMSQEEILSTVASVTGTFTTLLAGIAAISLVVGGIGIMNIMLVTVTERTREIGLRKAIGAKKRVIIYQFLTEAVLITFIGGLIGIILGLLISLLLAKIMSLPFVISPVSIILAFGVSVIIGISFGWYPARQAAKLQPIEALRYE